MLLKGYFFTWSLLGRATVLHPNTEASQAATLSNPVQFSVSLCWDLSALIDLIDSYNITSLSRSWANSLSFCCSLKCRSLDTSYTWDMRSWPSNSCSNLHLRWREPDGMIATIWEEGWRFFPFNSSHLTGSLFTWLLLSTGLSLSIICSWGTVTVPLFGPEVQVVLHQAEQCKRLCQTYQVWKGQRNRVSIGHRRPSGSLFRLGSLQVDRSKPVTPFR